MSQVDPKVQSTASAPAGSGMTAFEKEQIRVERLKAWLTAASIAGPLIAAILTYSSAQRVQRQEAETAFKLKVAEIVMASRTPWEAKGKATALAAFFPDRVPTTMADKFDPEKQGWGRESRRELLMLLTAHTASPDHRTFVLKTWKKLFPGDKWIDDFSQVP